MSESITRLHITPLTADLLPSVLPASLRAAATDISFHTIPTFPENNYGYITLPNMEAEKIKKKLNGSILKGKKFKIESARPSKRQRNEEAESEPAPAEKKKSKKRKSDDQVLEGYELPSDRKVKRGWTEPSGSKKEKGRSEKKNKKEKKEKPQPKSKYTEKPECLFRTTVPPNRSSESADDKNAKKKKKKSSESVVHEFGKTMSHPSFLRSTGDGSAPTATFDEEKGWVDATGAVKEPPSQKARKHDYRPGQVAGTKLKGSGKSSNRKAKTPTPASSSESEDWTSSSGSSDESSDSESEATTVAPASSTEDSASAPNAATDDAESEAAQDAEGKEVHPLEALFKRSAPAESQDQPAPNADTGFSFFENGDIESENEAPPAEPQTPFTPFTKRDLQVRGLRSAAPTPDTGLPSRQRQWAEEDMEDDDVSIESPVSKSRGLDLGLGKEETEFAKWFWENRGENNRAWKKRRRDVAKEQRQRENRKKGMKGKS
ncbi:Nucleotide-binding alpha-beta plait [Penicillium capsulatum]|uniref:Nucleotide-binding alpha-beta plait n=1 Tax=Penicillium capsulatum TaxID=69766 RepID=A0A9W9IKY1_9EURO|nr:Nucleotide-binding alpha-beta plait [Penicillium capsulatum]